MLQLLYETQQKKQKDTKDIRNVTKRNPETAWQFRDTTFYIILLISNLVT